MEFEFVTIGTDKLSGQFPRVREPATIAKRRTNEANLPPAGAADIPFIGTGALTMAKLADRRIQQVQTRVDDAGHGGKFILFGGDGKQIH